MRKFEVTLTYKSRTVKSVSVKNVMIKQQKVVDVELDDEYCTSPEQFCDSVISISERPEVVRINIKEENLLDQKPLHWVGEQFGRIYFYNGIPIVYNRN
jgi:hypothetical protein